MQFVENPCPVRRRADTVPLNLFLCHSAQTESAARCSQTDASTARVRPLYSETCASRDAPCTKLSKFGMPMDCLWGANSQSAAKSNSVCDEDAPSTRTREARQP